MKLSTSSAVTLAIIPRFAVRGSCPWAIIRITTVRYRTCLYSGNYIFLNLTLQFRGCDLYFGAAYIPANTVPIIQCNSMSLDTLLILVYFHEPPVATVSGEERMKKQEMEAEERKMRMGLRQKRGRGSENSGRKKECYNYFSKFLHRKSGCLWSWSLHLATTTVLTTKFNCESTFSRLFPAPNKMVVAAKTVQWSQEKAQGERDRFLDRVQ